MIRYFVLHGQSYNPPLDHIQAEEETERRRKEGDPLVLAYDEFCAAKSKELADAINQMPIMRALKRTTF